MLESAGTAVHLLSDIFIFFFSLPNFNYVVVCLHMYEYINSIYYIGLYFTL